MSSFLLLLSCGLFAKEDPPEETPRDTEWPSSETGTESDPPDDTSEDCWVQVEEVQPGPNQQGWSIHAPLVATLTDPSPSAKLHMPGVAGQSTNEDETLTFTPSSPLTPLTTYTAELQLCGDAQSWDFTTSELGLPLEEPLQPTVYRLDPGTGQITEPAGVGSVLQQYVEVSGLVRLALDGQGLSVDLAVADDDWVQDPCNPSSTVAASFSEPTFRFGPQDVSINGRVAQDLEFQGSIAPDGQSIGDVWVRMIVDTREFKELVGEDAGDSEVCDLLAGFGVSCVTCEVDGTPYCLAVTIEGLEGEARGDDLTLTETCLPECEVEGVCQTSQVCACGPAVPVSRLLLGLLALVGLRRSRGP